MVMQVPVYGVELPLEIPVCWAVCFDKEAEGGWQVIGRW